MVVGAIFKNPRNKFLGDMMSLLSEESGKLRRKDVSLYSLLQSIWNRCAVTKLGFEGDRLLSQRKVELQKKEDESPQGRSLICDSAFSVHTLSTFGD